MLLLAHRGASADAPENTLTAFAEAARQGADGVELDVMLCASGELVVCHDEKLDRLAGLPWRVQATPLALVNTSHRKASSDPIASSSGLQSSGGPIEIAGTVIASAPYASRSATSRPAWSLGRVTRTRRP